MVETIRERRRSALRAELANAAADFCAERGFDEVTVDEIAEAIGVSRATFFRYFASKEEVIVASIRIGRQSFADQLLDSPPASGARAMDAVRDAMSPTVDEAQSSPERLRKRMRMISDSPALRAHLASERSEQRDRLEEILLQLIKDPAEASATAHASMAAIDLTWNLWRADTGSDFGLQLKQSFALISGVESVVID